MSKLYKKINIVDLPEGAPVQYLGMYALQWKHEFMGDPTVAFVEVDDVDESTYEMVSDEILPNETEKHIAQIAQNGKSSNTALGCVVALLLGLGGWWLMTSAMGF